MLKITERQFREKQRKLQTVIKELDESKERMRMASDQGDLSENAEYDAARDAVTSLLRQKQQLESEIDDAEIVSDDNGPRIMIGSTVRVTPVDSANKPLAEPRQFRVEERGDTVIEKVLGVHSSLGKVILNGTSNYYDIPDNGGMRYYVEKVISKN